MADDNQVQALVEDMNSKFEAIMEYVKDIPEIKDRITHLEEQMEQVLKDIQIHSHEIAELKTKN